MCLRSLARAPPGDLRSLSLSPCLANALPRKAQPPKRSFFRGQGVGLSGDGEAMGLLPNEAFVAAGVAALRSRGLRPAFFLPPHKEASQPFSPQPQKALGKLAFLLTPRRALRHRVSQVSGDADCTLQNPLVARHWPHLLLFEAPRAAGEEKGRRETAAASAATEGSRKLVAEAEAALLERGCWSGRPLASTPAALLRPQSKAACRELIHILSLQEVKRLQKSRPFRVGRRPRFGLNAEAPKGGRKRCGKNPLLCADAGFLSWRFGGSKVRTLSFAADLRHFSG